MAISSRAYAFTVTVTACLALVVGLLIGYLSTKAAYTKGTTPESAASIPDNLVSRLLIDEIKPENIRENLRFLSAKPNLAGTDADRRLAAEIKKRWESQGLTSVTLTPYDVLLSYPDKTNPNKVELRDGNDDAIYTSQLVEKILRSEQNQSGVVPPFNSYCSSGTPKGDLIYVNYGRIEDFDWLKTNRSIDFTGKIAIARYGKIFRGNKASNAEKYGAAGLIMYTDPADFAPEGVSDVYPDSWWLPGTGVQRGSLILRDGDLLTPGYPATKSAYRISLENAKLISIPVHPIGYTDAKKLLENMRGEVAPASWHGRLPIDYRIGPGFKNDKWKVQMHVAIKNERKTTYNVHGFIKGHQEPDRYVIIGNHRDAWVFGALDPASGTAAMLELSRAMGQLVKNGWKPRRSILFCSWGAEEYGLVGSDEWVESYKKNLANRAIAYLNVDIAVQGNHTFRGKSLPLMNKILHEATKQIPNPNPDEIKAGRLTVYDTWANVNPATDKDGNILRVPRINFLGSGSDYAPFVNKLGVTSVDLRYTYNAKLWKLSSYPLYHSVYETFHLVEKYVDPEFKYHAAVTQIWGEIARDLADSLIIPFNVSDYSVALYQQLGTLQSQHGALMSKNGLSAGLDYLRSAIDKFKDSTDKFENHLKSVNKENVYEVRRINDQLMQIERAFIDPMGIPTSKAVTYRHVVFAPSQHDSYAGSSFPGLADSLFDIERRTDVQKWERVKQQLAAVTHIIESAATTIVQVTEF